MNFLKTHKKQIAIGLGVAATILVVGFLYKANVDASELVELSE